MKTITMFNFKGGVGKTTICVQCAPIFAAQGSRVLLIDLDPQKNSTRYYSGENSVYPRTVKNLLDSRDGSVTSIRDVIYPVSGIENLWLVPAENDVDLLERQLMTDSFTNIGDNPRCYLAKYLEEVQDDFDLVIIDTHPSRSMLVNINALVASDFIFTPVNSDIDSFEGINGLLDTYRECCKLNPNLQFGGVIFNDFSSRASIDKEALSTLIRTMDGYLLESIIPHTTQAVRSKWDKIPAAHKKDTKLSQAYRELTDEITQRIGGLA